MTSETNYRVYLHARGIGWLCRRDDYTKFVLDESYIVDPNRAVLGLRFEDNLRARCAANMRLPAWFSNLLPEGPLRQWISLSRQVSIDREMELLAQVGHDLPGAVRVLADSAKCPVDISERDGSASPKAAESPRWRFSLAGVGLKFSMLAQRDRFVAPAAGGAGDWIVKLPSFDHPSVPLNEYAMMLLAQRTGIEVPEIRLVHRDEVDDLPEHVWPPGEEHAYAIRRFDRGPKRELVHMEDLAQVRGIYPGSHEKYTGSFETVAALLFRGHDLVALREFARRLAFNILIGNGDAHLKNWSLLYRNPRVPTISPAYDLVATDAYRPADLGSEDLGLKFGGTRRFEQVRLAHFSALESRLNAKADLTDVVSSFVRKVVEEWGAAEEALGSATWLRDAVKRRIQQFAPQLR